MTSIAPLPSHRPSSTATEGLTPQLSVIVPLFNCLPLTQVMLASLRATLPPHCSHEIIFVDDGSTDGTREWLATLTPPVRVIFNERNLGYAAANNRGAAAAAGAQLLLLNNDLVFRPRWLEPMLAVQRRLGARVGLVGNVQRRISDGAVDHCGIFINLKGKPEHQQEMPLRAVIPLRRVYQRVDAVTGACLLVPRELYQSFGGFSEEFVNGGEDVDLAFRLAEAGRVNVVALRSIIDHHVSSSPGRKRRDEVNTYRLTLRWREALASRAARRWCRDYLVRHWTSPTASTDAWLAAEALTYAIFLRRSPPATALMEMHAAINLELARWRTMFREDESAAGDGRQLN